MDFVKLSKRWWQDWWRKHQQPPGESHLQWWMQPRLYLYGVAGLLLIWGQVQIIQAQVFRGVFYSLAGMLAFLLALISRAWWQAVYQSSRKTFEKVLPLLKRFDINKYLPTLGPSENPATVLPPSPAEELPESIPPKPSLMQKLHEQEIYVTRKALLVISGILILSGQPFLFLEKIALALLLIVPGLCILVSAILVKVERISFCRQDTLIKSVFLGLPGISLVIIGSVMTARYVSLDFTKEVIGLSLNALGIFLLISLFPSQLNHDSDSPREVMDEITGKAVSPAGLVGKLLLAALGYLLLTFSRGSWVDGNSGQAVVYALLGLAALLVSFPWSREPRNLPTEKTGLRTSLINFIRLALFGVALYLGYHGQTLISHEQLYPGLYRFLAAAIALVIALREPDPGHPDAGQERPLAWYWEALGLIIILAVGTWLRFRLLDIMPYGIECDEAAGGVHALDILKGDFRSLTAHPCGQPLFMLLPKVVAMHFLGDGNIGIRFMSAVWGVLGIFSIHLLARHFYGPRIALAVAALFALSRWHLHFSRFGFSNTLFIVLLMLGFYFFIKGIEDRRKWHLVLSGVSLSIALQTETAARLIPFICLSILFYFTLFRTRFLFKNWKLVIVFMLGIWMAGANIMMFWAGRTQVMSRRAAEVSIFSKDPNAPRDIAKGFVASVKHSLAQLNWHGDGRTRHNGGLSGAPTLDFWTAILFTLGFGFSIYHWKRLRYFIALIWFFGFMSASVFAIEAPQSHRAFGMFPTIYLFIGAFLDRGRRLLRQSLGRAGVWAGGLVFLLLLVPIAKDTYQKYFDTFPAFDTSCTAAARFMGRQYPKAEHYIMTAYLWMGHPPFQLYARDISGSFYYMASDVMPFRKTIDDDAVVSFLLEYQPLLKSLQWFYPEGKYFEEIHHKYGSQFQAWVVPHEEVLKTRGLTAKYWNNGSWSGSPAVTRKDQDLEIVFNQENWPLPGYGSVAWEGTLLAPHEGEYTLYLYATDSMELRVGDNTVLRAENRQETRQKVWLAGGLHRLRARARHRNAQDRILFAWSCQRKVPYYLYGSPFQKAFFKQAVPDTHFYTYPRPAGLLGTIYASENWEGEILQQKIEPALLFVWMGTPCGFPAPLSADWRGHINIETPGYYQFILNHGGYGEVEVGGHIFYRNGRPPGNWQPRGEVEKQVWLEAGKYPVIVRWGVSGPAMLKFWWIPPGGQREIVPASVLTPAAE